MLYDRHEMRPLFQLQIGNPGSSFAVEIARKIGLPEEVIADASEIVGSEYIQSDKYLQDIVRDKRYWETKRQRIHQREKADGRSHRKIPARNRRTGAEPERDSEKGERRCRTLAERVKRKNREHNPDHQGIAGGKEKPGRHARNWKTSSARWKRRKKAAAEEKIARKMEQLRQKQERKKSRKEQQKAEDAARETPKARPIMADDYVRIKGQTSVGQVLETNPRNTVVMFGLMKTNVKTERLERAEAPQTGRPGKVDLREQRNAGTDAQEETEFQAGH